MAINLVGSLSKNKQDTGVKLVGSLGKIQIPQYTKPNLDTDLKFEQAPKKGFISGIREKTGRFLDNFFDIGTPEKVAEAEQNLISQGIDPKKATRFAIGLNQGGGFMPKELQKEYKELSEQQKKIVLQQSLKVASERSADIAIGATEPIKNVGKPILKGILKKSIPTISKDLSPLAQEARKYKTAEEFADELIKNGKIKIEQISSRVEPQPVLYYKGNKIIELEDFSEKTYSIKELQKYGKTKPGTEEMLSKMRYDELKGRIFGEQTKSQLTDIYNQAVKGTDDITTSIQQAKASGQSFDEWVKGLKKLYRGETNAVRDERTVKGIMSTSENPEIAKIFSGENGIAKEFLLDPKTKIIKLEDITKELSKTKNQSSITTQDWINYAKEKGYDAIDMKSLKLNIQSKTNPNLKGFEDEIKILNPDAIKTRSQLKAEWDAVKTAPEAQKGVASALKAEKGVIPQESIFLPKTVSEFNELTFEKQDEIFGKLPDTLKNEIMGVSEEVKSVGGSPLDDIASKIVKGDIKIKAIPFEKTEFIDEIGKGKYMQIFRKDESLDTIDTIASNVDATTSELRDAISKAIKRDDELKKYAKDEREFIKFSKEATKADQRVLAKQIGEQRQTKALGGSFISRLKEKVGIKEWSNATKEQLQSVLDDMKKFQKGDEMISRSQVEALKEYGIKSTTTKREAAQMLGEISEWKQKTKSRFFNFFKTIDQKIDNVAGKDADKIKNILTRPREEAVAKMFKEEIQLKTAMKDMLDNFGINNAKDRGLIMKFGEKRITLEELKKATPKWNEIIEADKWFRKNYDDLLESTNSELRRLGYSEDKLIPKRQDYYTHAQELGSMWETIKNTGGDISPVLEQISEFTRPNRKFNPFALQRKGGKEFVEDAGKAFEAYLTPVLNNKYLTESIIRHRAVADILAHNTLQSKNLNQFIGSLRYEADNLAGKTNPFDRPLMNFVVGRKGVQLVNLATQRFGKNRIIGNVGSALMQISGIPNSVLKNNLVRTSKGLLTQAVSPLLGASDPILKSKALLIRYGEKGLQHGETVFPTLVQKGGNILGIPFEVIEKNISKGIWRASFDNAWSQGFRGQELMTKADEIFKSVVGSRAIGEKAMAFESGILSLPLQFQLEVNTHAQLWKEEVFSKIFKDPAKATRAAIETSITLFLLNTLFEKTMGRTPLPDPIRAVSEATEADSWLEGVGRIAGEGLSSVAGGQFIANLMPEDFKKKYFGRSEVGIYPGGIPIANAISGAFQSPVNFVYDFALPYGGAQLKKILQGIDGLDKMGSYNKNGKLQFPINQNQWLQVILFGKYSTKEAKEYFDKQRTTLSEKQTVEYFLRTQKGENPPAVYNDIIKDRIKGEYEREIIKEVIKKIKSKPDEGLALLQLWKKENIISDKMEKDIIEGLK